DRYGVPDAPRGPFRAGGFRHDILELPPARLDLLGLKLPAGGGGYFRLFPLFLMEQALHQVRRGGEPPVAMLYFPPRHFAPRPGPPASDAPQPLSHLRRHGPQPAAPLGAVASSPLCAGHRCRQPARRARRSPAALRGRLSPDRGFIPCPVTGALSRKRRARRGSSSLVGGPWFLVISRAGCRG